MTDSALPRTTEILASFFQRLASMEGIIRVIVSQVRVRALFSFRGDPQKNVLLDLTASPVRVLLDEEARDGQIFMTVDGRIMHEILLDRMKPGLAVGRREMLLRGSAMNFAKFIPLFEFGPVLYKEHLADIGCDGYARPNAPALPKEALMSGQVFKGDPVPLVELSGFEKLFFKVVNGIAYGVGYLVGLLRYRLFEKMSLFEVLAAMSRGLDAASPKALGQGQSRSEPSRENG